MMEEKIVTIDRLAYGGEGVGRNEGKVIFVPGTAPGDKVLVRVTSDGGRFERGQLVSLLEKSPTRVEPLCPVFGTCGGCQWQHLSYATQVKMKAEIVHETLVRMGQIVHPPVLPIISASDPWNYRRRIQLKIDPEGKIGFYAAKSHQVVPFEECKIADPQLNKKLAEIRLGAEKFESGFELLMSNHGVEVIKDSGGEKVFSQVNREQNRHLIDTVINFVFGNAHKAFTERNTLVELYAGSGNFTFPLAEKAGRLIAVEENPCAIEKAELESQARKISNIQWIKGSAEWGLKKIYRRKIAVDTLVLDPPRRGAHEILDLIPLIRPRTIVYVSCDPTTLARDLKVLVRRHYRLDKVQPIDMFPQTYHIESVASLSLA